MSSEWNRQNLILSDYLSSNFGIKHSLWLVNEWSWLDLTSFAGECHENVARIHTEITEQSKNTQNQNQEQRLITTRAIKLLLFTKKVRHLSNFERDVVFASRHRHNVWVRYDCRVDKSLQIFRRDCQNDDASMNAFSKNILIMFCSSNSLDHRSTFTLSYSSRTIKLRLSKLRRQQQHHSPCHSHKQTNFSLWPLRVRDTLFHRGHWLTIKQLFFSVWHFSK